MSETTAMQNAAVYSCVRVISEAIASLPLNIYKSEGDGNKIASDHHLYYLLHDEPNPEMTSFVFRETLMGHLLLWGNAYAQIIRDGGGRVTGLYPLLPSKIDVSRNEQGEIYYTYWREEDESHRNEESGKITFQKHEVLHIPGLGYNGLVGYSPIAMVKNAVGLAIATENYGASFFANGAMPGGVIESAKSIDDPDDLSELWDSIYRGSLNAGRIAILEDGLKFSPISVPPDQAQFLETRKFQLNEICRIFRIPPHMIGDLDRSTYSNIEHQSLEFVKFTLEPWLKKWEQTLKQTLFAPSEKRQYFVKFNLDGLLRGDYETRMKGYAIGRQNGWFSVNDIRKLEDFNPISAEEGGDLYLVNGNMMKLKDAGAAYNKGGDAK